MSSAVGDGCNAISKKTCSTKEQLLSHHQLQWDFTQGAAYYSLMQIELFPCSVCCLVLKCIFFEMWIYVFIFLKDVLATREMWLNFIQSAVHLGKQPIKQPIVMFVFFFFFFLLCVVLTRWRGFREFDEPKSLWYEKSPTPYSQWKRVWCGKKL